MEFKGDIIITDPCYISSLGPIDLWNEKDFDIFDGDGLDKYGFTKYIWEATYVGDWSCETLELKEETNDISNDKLKGEHVKDSIGNFCADSGMVGVFLLDEVLKFNPNFDYHIKKPHTTTLIKDFDGEIEFSIVEGQGLNWGQLRGKGNVNFITIMP